MITLMPPVPAKLVAIGNSRGVRIPKAMIEQIGLGEDVELEVVDGTIVRMDQDHLTANFALKVAPEMERQLVALGVFD